MARTIKVDPARLETASQKIDGQVADYERQYNQLFSEVEGMGAAWQGKDNKEFVQRISGFRDDFQFMKRVMEEYSNFLKTSAQSYKNAQNETINAARRLAY